MMNRFVCSYKSIGTSPQRFSHLILFSCLVFSLLFSNSLVAADPCYFNATSGVNFGQYNVFATVPNTNGIGNVTIYCKGNPGMVVALSSGQSNTYSSRVMQNGVNQLNYNLYTSSARTNIWGDGSGGSITVVIPGNGTTSLSIFGQIPAGQNLPAGTYTDVIIVMIDF